MVQEPDQPKSISKEPPPYIRAADDAQPDIRSTDTFLGSIFADKFDVTELIGSGGMSTVYKARHMVMDKEFALKVLHAHECQNNVAVRRFQMEAQAASTIIHPGVVAIYDCGEYGGRLYLVMDFVQGQSLAQILATEGPLTLTRFLSIMLQVSQAVAHAHKNGIVHRDLKPSNIMVTKSGETEIVKIVDFGIAKVLSGTGSLAHQLTTTGEFCGTPYYMSPEQCSGTQVDARSDIYSLGCVMFEALTGDVPFRALSIFETITKHVIAPPPPLVAPQIDGENKQRLELVVLRALAKNASDRFQSMDELESELRSLNLKSKGGVFAHLGKAWDLASVKRRAERKNRLPIMVITLCTVSCLSIISMAFLLSALHNSNVGIARLEQIRQTQNAICQLFEKLAHVTTAARPYQQSIFLSPQSVEENKKDYDETVRNSETQLNRVGTELLSSQKLHNDFTEHWSPELAGSIHHFGDSIYDMHKKAGGRAVATNTDNIHHIFYLMTDDVTRANKVLTEMIQGVDFVEQRQLEQVHNTERWIDYVAYLCLALNGAVVVTLFIYFAKGTPQRLKQLSQTAANISKVRGLGQAPSGQDVVEDLDMALQVLATALTEADEREQLFRERERQLQKQLAEKTGHAADSAEDTTRSADAAASGDVEHRNVIRANFDSHLVREAVSRKGDTEHDQSQ